MPNKCFKLLLLLLISSATLTRAQTTYNNIIFKIDSLSAMGLPKSALAEVDKLDKLAHQNNNSPQIIRAVIYRITFQSFLQEEALVPIIKTLKTDIQQTDFPVKPVLQSLLANMYWQYYQQHRWDFNGRTRLEKADLDYTRWDLQTLVTETDKLYRQSLQSRTELQSAPIGVLNGVITGDATTRYLRPTLYDLLAHRALDFYLDEEPALPKPRNPFNLRDARLFGDSRTFATLKLSTTDTASTLYRGILLLQQATAFHLQKNNTEALADLNLKRLKFLHKQLPTPDKDKLYLTGLQQVADSFAGKPIVADVWVLLGQYHEEKDSLVAAFEDYNKAVTLYPKSQGAYNAAILIKQVKQQELSTTVENVYAADKPMLALLNYRNVGKAQVLLYKLTIAQLGQLNKLHEGYDYDEIRPTKEVLKYLNTLKPSQAQTLDLPNTQDYRKHSAEFKLNSQTFGNYLLLVKQLNGDKPLAQLVQFKVTNLAYVARQNPDGRRELRVVDRQTGKPLAGVQTNVTFEENRGKRQKVKLSGITNNEGRYLFSSANNFFHVELKYGNDVFTDRDRYVSGSLARTSTNEPIDQSIIFTDRQLYRPGQTVYFKVLQLQKLQQVTSIVPGANVKVSFKDANAKVLNTVDLKTNEFGTASGSFIIPQNVLGGAMSIVTGYSNTFIQVEEYKRPTFTAHFEPVIDSYRLNDSVKVQGKVTAFSGYGLSQARVAYQINLDYETNDRENNIVEAGNVIAQQIKTDTVITDNEGRFTIRFKATDNQMAFQAIYNYSINATITDASGETHTANQTVKVSASPLLMDVLIPARLLSKDDADFKIKLQNVNGQPQAGVAQVSVYKLNAPNQAFKERLWAAPDQVVMEKGEFKKNFPAYAWQQEDDKTKWAQTNIITEFKLTFEKDKPGNLNLQILLKQPSGNYKVVIKSQNSLGDTASYVQYVTLSNQPSKISKLTDWVTQVKTTVKPGEAAQFLVGTGGDGYVLMEKYNGVKLLTSKWLTLSGDLQHLITVNFPAEKGEYNVQFLTVRDNRAYKDYEAIIQRDSVKMLPVKFLTYRNKLQPGEKEQWKIQVGDGASAKEMAEMVATLYDASLDEIVPNRPWGINTGSSAWPTTYYAWNGEDIVTKESSLEYGDDEYAGVLKEHKYEELFLFGYNYFGGYNSAYQHYIENVARTKTQSLTDKNLAATYFKNAAFVKTGFDVVGRIIEADYQIALPGVKVAIKGTDISTLSNSGGYFRIKVPLASILVISRKGYINRQIAAKKGERLFIYLRDKRWLKIIDPGQKDIKGDPTQTIRINEPVGNAPVTIMADTATISAGYMARSANQVKFPPPVVAADENNIFQNVNDSGDQANKQNIKSPQVTIRKNFNETAFFYPQLHTDARGQILIDFTVPESLTKWRFKAFAHTQSLVTGYIENEVVTQKQLMISANMPRFMREGDTIVVSARVANLSTETLKGEVQLQLFNAVTMQPVNVLVNKTDGNQHFEVEAGVNKAVSFNLIVPGGLDALTYRLTAATNSYSDGEENTLPVLPNRMLVTESMPMLVRAGQTKAFTFDKLLNQKSNTLINKTLTLEYTQNPAWYAVQALPYLMEFPYECSEQTFSRYIANSVAASIVKHNPQIKSVFERWKATDSKELLSNLEKNPELKATLIEETPWLQDAVSESEQKKRLALLFDLNKLGYEQKKSLEQLQKKQLPDGGFPWFGDRYADRFITQHIIAGIGQLYRLKTADGVNLTLEQISAKGIHYIDMELINDAKQRATSKDKNKDDLSALEIHAWYARSYHPNAVIGEKIKVEKQQYITRATNQWLKQPVYQQALIALSLLRYGKPQVANAIIRSLIETVQQSDDAGMYWAKNQSGWYWHQSPVETQSLMIELFTEAGNQSKAIEEMKIWLLRNKQTNNWRTTKATAAACYALLMKGDTLLSTTESSTIKLNGKPLTEINANLQAETGTGYIKTTWADESVKPALGKVEIANTGKTLSWGAMHWQYTEQLDKITSSNTDITLERKYFIEKQDQTGKVLVAVDAQHQPQTGDVLKVVVYLKSGHDLEYVQLKDMRPAGTEPVDILSDFKYQDGLYYYQVTRDVATNFFISSLHKGSYVLEYRLRVVQPGNFASGITTVQSMYAPEFNAHSEGKRMEIEKVTKAKLANKTIE
jgi:uncharacterized protein YfaS (alpha-2-macroglobulin family)